MTFTAPAAGTLTAVLSTRGRHSVVLARGHTGLTLTFTPVTGKASALKGSLSLAK